MKFDTHAKFTDWNFVSKFCDDLSPCSPSFSIFAKSEFLPEYRDQFSRFFYTFLESRLVCVEKRYWLANYKNLSQNNNMQNNSFKPVSNDTLYLQILKYG